MAGISAEPVNFSCSPACIPPAGLFRVASLVWSIMRLEQAVHSYSSSTSRSHCVVQFFQCAHETGHADCNEQDMPHDNSASGLAIEVAMPSAGWRESDIAACHLLHPCPDWWGHHWRCVCESGETTGMMVAPAQQRRSSYHYSRPRGISWEPASDCEYRRSATMKL